MALGFAPSPSMAATSSTTASVSFNHFYIITSYGFGTTEAGGFRLADTPPAAEENDGG